MGATDADIDMHLGRRLRRRRLLLGLTQDQLAGACGVRFQQIQKYECGGNRISASRLWRLCAALDVPASYFYDGIAGTAPADQDPVPDEDRLARKETLELIRAYNLLAEGPRLCLLALAISMHDAAAPAG